MKKLNLDLELDNDKILEAIENLDDFGFQEIDTLDTIQEIGKKGTLKKLTNDNNFWNNIIENEALIQIPKNVKNDDLLLDKLPNTSIEAIRDINARLLKVDNWEARINEVEKETTNLKTLVNTLDDRIKSLETFKNETIPKLPIFAKFSTKVRIKDGETITNVEFRELMRKIQNGSFAVVWCSKINSNFILFANGTDVFFRNITCFTDTDGASVPTKSFNFNQIVNMVISHTASPNGCVIIKNGDVRYIDTGCRSCEARTTGIPLGNTSTDFLELDKYMLIPNPMGVQLYA